MSGSLGDAPRVNLDAARRAAEQLVRLEQRRSDGQQSRPMRAALHAATQVFDHENPAYLEALLRLKRFPVTIDEFVESREFYAEQEEIWPALREDLRRINPDILTGTGHVDEVIFGGATGTGKTTTARTSACYMLYFIQCFDNPQLLFGLSRATPIVFILTSVSQAVTKRVVYKPLRQNFLSMPFVKRYIPHDYKIESALKLPYNVEVVPVLAQINSLVGQAVIGGIVDEANFMAVVEKSSKVVGTDGTGGHFDQAEVVYTNMVRRRKSRFTSRGPSPGAIMAISSTAYKGDFIDRRIEEIETRQPPRSIVVTHKQYEVKPEFANGNYETFPVLIGTEDYPTRVLTEEDVEGLSYPEGARVEHVPVAYKTDFERDPEGSARDVIGASSAAISPFILQRNKIGDAFVRYREAGFKAITPFPIWHLTRKAMPPWVKQFIKDPKVPRYVHVDLAISGDRCGVAMSRVVGFENRRRESEDGMGVVESVPLVALDFAIGIQPSAVQQLDIAELRRWLMGLMVDHKVNIVSVTYDGYQSKESIQQWRRAGVFSKEFSVDRTTEPYDYLRRTFYEDRIFLPHSEALHQELMRLEFDKRKGKVDHPPRGSKDISDAVAASVFQAANSRGARLLAGTYHDDGEPATRPEDYSKRQPIIRSNIRRR